MTQQREQALARFETEWPAHAPDHAEVQARFIEAYDSFHALGLADPHFDQELLSGGDVRFAQRLGEMLLAQRLRDAGFVLNSRPKGPDLRATKDGRAVWLELITPEPRNFPPDWFEPGEGAWTVPNDQMLLRWTAAIKEKKDRGQAYLVDGVLTSDEPYVIVVNNALLSRWGTELRGISQKPFVVEATLGVGPLQIRIDRTTLETVDTGHQHRPNVTNKNQSQVPADTFFDPAYRHVSAVMGTTLDTRSLRRAEWENYLAHNPNAVSLVPYGFLPANEEWACRVNQDGYMVYKVASPSQGRR